MYELVKAPATKAMWVLYFKCDGVNKIVARFYKQEVAEAALELLNDRT